MTDTQLENIERLAAKLIHLVRRRSLFLSDYGQRQCTIAADDLETALKDKEATDGDK